MKRLIPLFTLLILSFVFIFAFATKSAPAAHTPVLEHDFVVVQAFYDNLDMVAQVSRTTEPWEIDHQKQYIVLDVDADQYQKLEEAGFTLVIDDHLTTELNKPRVALPNQGGGIPGYPCYRTVEETFATAQDLAANYPNLAEWTDVGDSWEKTEPGGLDGYDMMVLRLTNETMPGPKPKLFMTSAIHAREYTTAELNTRFAEYLINNYGTNADATWLLDHHEIHLMLQTNPDGRKRAETGLLWRKNTNNNYCANSNSRGADLNRNFQFQWDCCGGSSNSQCSDTYHGPSAASEPEVQAVQNYIFAEYPDLRDPDINAAAPLTTTGIYIDIHSYSELVLWPWGFTNQGTGNDTELVTLGRKLAYFNDYTPQQAIELYITDGTTDDFVYGEVGLPAYTYELGTSFFQSCGTFESTIYPDNLTSLIYAAKAVREPYIAPAGPDATSVALAPIAVAAGDPVTLTATLDDSRFNNSNGTEPVQNVSAAEYYIDVPSWITSTTPVPIAMSAADGSFNSSVEDAVAVIDTTSLSEGQHIIYVRGQDSNGTWGVYSAAFLYIIDPAVAPTLAGEVTAADTNSPLAATITANGTFQTTSNPTTGIYQMQVISDTYQITAVADDPNYAPVTVTGIVAPNGQTVQQDFQLFPYCDVFTDDVESGTNGWAAQAPWAITTESAHSPSNSWTDSPGGNYGNNQNITLTSPVIDLAGYENITLNYWQICDTEAGYDYCHVEVSADGSNWDEIATFDGSSTQWEEISLDVPTLNNQSNAQIRFRFSSDGSVTDDGWHVDDIQIRAAGAACLDNIAPQASFDSSSPDELGDTTSFTNTSTGTDLTFAWDFGDGSSSTDENPTHTYSTVGTYTVTLTATNQLGDDVTTGIVEILEAPQASFTLSAQVEVGETAVFTNTSTGTNLTYLWDFGDGDSSTDENPTHTYTLSGTYTVTLTTTNNVGTDTAVNTIQAVDPEGGYTIYLPIILALPE